MSDQKSRSFADDLIDTPARDAVDSFTVEKTIRLSIKGLLEKDGRYLLLREQIGEAVVTDLPGGGMEFGESPLETLTREIFEETQLHVQPERILGMYDFMRIDGGGQAVVALYLCSLPDYADIPAEEVPLDFSKNPANEYFSEYFWLTLEEILAMNDGTWSKSFVELIESLVAQQKK